jgi:hypothetical protein
MGRVTRRSTAGDADVTKRTCEQASRKRRSGRVMAVVPGREDETRLVELAQLRLDHLPAGRSSGLGRSPRPPSHPARAGQWHVGPGHNTSLTAARPRRIFTGFPSLQFATRRPATGRMTAARRLGVT